MQIYLSNSKGEQKFLGRTEDGIIVPRVGENVYVGYAPPPKVLSVTYTYKNNIVIVLLDTGFSFNLE